VTYADAAPSGGFAIGLLIFFAVLLILFVGLIVVIIRAVIRRGRR
jgi:hypothetical protein